MLYTYGAKTAQWFITVLLVIVDNLIIYTEQACNAIAEWALVRYMRADTSIYGNTKIVYARCSNDDHDKPASHDVTPLVWYHFMDRRPISCARLRFFLLKHGFDAKTIQIAHRQLTGLHVTDIDLVDERYIGSNEDVHYGSIQLSPLRGKLIAPLA